MDRATVESVLNQIEWLGHVGTSGDHHFSCRCLMMHEHEKGYDSRASATVSFGKRRSWVECFSCGYKSTLEKTLHALAAINRVSPQLALDYAGAKMNTVILESKVIETPIQDYSIPIKYLQDNDYSQSMLDFLEKKNVDPDIARKFGLAYVPEGHSDEWMPLNPETQEPRATREEGIVLPSMSKLDGKWVPVGAQMRMFGDKFRYYAIYRFKAQDRLFAEQILPSCSGKHVFVVEGPFDALHILGLGFAAVALYGTSLTEKKALLLSGANPKMVHMLFDPDAAGRAGKTKSKKVLDKFGLPYILHEPEKDPKLMTRAELADLVNVC